MYTLTVATSLQAALYLEYPPHTHGKEHTLTKHLFQDFKTGTSLPPCNITYIGAPNMTYSRNPEYQYGAPYHPQGLHFQPPVPDTTYGPIDHVYVPRHDGIGPQVPPGLTAQVCYPHSYAQRPAMTHIPVTTRPAAAQVYLGHAGFVPSYSVYASRLLLAAPILIVFCYMLDWGAFGLLGWIALLFLIWLFVSVAGYKSAEVLARCLSNFEYSQVPLQPQIALGTNPPLTVHHPAPMPTFQPQAFGQPSAFVSTHVMPGTYPMQPVQNQTMYAAVPTMVPGVQGVPGSVTANLPPDVTGIGKTIAEIQAYHSDIAMASGVVEPEDFEPASKDPSKMYYCRELDGNWTLRSRYSIDQMGDWRWYQTPTGIFYAVRLPS